MIVENKRDSLAHLSARRSCLVDTERGALNLFFNDRILPPLSRCLIDHLDYGLINYNFYFQPSAPAAPDIGSTQRILLDIAWEDGTTEQLDLTYEMLWRNTPAQPDAES